MACRSSGRPAAGVYLWNRGSAQARWAASTMYPGVGKSGSPAPKPMTGLPAAFSALALASTASVADSEIADTRAETLVGMRTMLAGGTPPIPPVTGGYPPPVPPGGPGSSTEGRFGRTLHEPAAEL